MKFSCKTQEFLQSINIVGRAIGGQQTLPILGNILIEIEGKRCTLSATDLELSIVSSFEANIENEGSITVPAKALLNFAQYNSDDEVLLETVEGTQLKCTSPSAKTVISGEQASEYPTIAPVSKEISFSLPVESLLDAIAMTSYAAAKTTLRPVLSGVFLRIDSKELILAATDSYRLSEYRVPLEKEIKHDVSCIIPAKVLDELRAVISNVQGKDDGKKEKGGEDKKKKEELVVDIILNDQQIELQVGSVRILSRLIEGKFPDYQQIIPKETSTSVPLPFKELVTTTKRMHYFAKEINNNLLFHIGSSGVAMSTPQTQIGKDEATIKAKVTGGEVKIALSSTYVLDFLSHSSGDIAIMEVQDSMHPAVFKLPERENFLHLIMPLRLQEE